MDPASEKITSNTQVDSTSPENGSLSANGKGEHAPYAQDLDQAYWYVHDKENATSGLDAAAATPQELRRLRRKIDWWIVPIMFCCYTMQFIDKVILNYAAVMGINKDLKLTGNNFTNAATAFFIAYLIAEIPNAIVLQKIPVAKWLGANVILWGIATACTAAAKDYHSLLAARIFLGIFEAAIAPSLMLISSQWYTKSEAAPRFSIWYAGLGLGQIIGGVLSYAFQKVQHPSFAGWRIMFVVLGLVTVVIGFVTFFLLPDTPMKAHFLTEAEKVILLKHVAVNQTGISNKKFKPRQILEVLLDVQLWLMTLLTILVHDTCPPRPKRYSRRRKTDRPTDLHLKRCCHDVFGNFDQPLRIHPPTFSSSQHAIRRCLNHQHIGRRLGCPLHLQPMGLDRSMLYSRYPRRRSDVLCDQK